MNNSRRSPVANMVTMVFAVFAMIFLAQDGRIRMIVHFLFLRGEPNLRRLEFMWRADPQSVIRFAAFVFLGLVALISLIRMMLGLAGAIRSMMAGVAGSIVPEATVKDTRRVADGPMANTGTPGRRNGRTKAAGTPGRGDGRMRAAGTPGRRDGRETSQTYAYKSGQERYLEQLEGFLRDGLVTREQYHELLRMYQKADRSGRKQ